MLHTKTKQPGLARYLPLLLLAFSPAAFAENRPQIGRAHV